MKDSLAPASIPELVDAVRSFERLLPVGGETKPRLCAVNATKLSMLKLRGTLEYEPSEFTFTARAGTPLAEVVQTLAACGQYLPFDPVFVDSGGTLGGAVASNLNGPGRLRFGGIRDFILGARFVEGSGRLLGAGGKVVKNAAGFDLPKFFVGSVGRFGVLTELTFKVFPAAACTLTLKLAAKDMAAAARILIEAARSRWEPDALEIPAGDCSVLLRLAGPSAAIEQIAADILSRFPGEKLNSADADRAWSNIREFHWTHSTGPLVKVPVTPLSFPDLLKALEPVDRLRVHISGGGNAAYVSMPSAEQFPLFNKALAGLSLPGVSLRGEVPAWVGKQPRAQIADAVKRALDPQNRFPSLDE